MKMMIRIKKQLPLLSFILPAFFCSCETADSRYAEKINAHQEEYRQCVYDDENYDYVHYRIVHVKYKEEGILEEFPDYQIQENSVELTPKEEAVLRECFILLSLWNTDSPTCPCSWIWDNEYWIMCRGKRIMEIGPHGENVPIGLRCHFFWHAANRELQDAYKRARKKTVHN